MSETGLQVAEENQVVQMTKRDVERLLSYAVERTKSMTFSANGSSDWSIAEMKALGDLIYSAGLIPAQQGVEKSVLVGRGIAKAVQAKGWGIDPFMAQSLFHFIPTSGTIVPDYKALSARILGSGKYTYEIIEHTTEICTGQAYRIVDGYRVAKGEPMSYTLDQAKVAGLYDEDRASGKVTGTWPDGNPKIAKKGAWEAHTKDMLLSKLVRRLFIQHFADLYFLGATMKTSEDYQEEQAVEAPKQIEAAKAEADEPFFTNEPEAPAEEIESAAEPAPDASKIPAESEADAILADLMKSINAKIGDVDKLTKDSRREYDAIKTVDQAQAFLDELG